MYQHLELSTTSPTDYVSPHINHPLAQSHDCDPEWSYKCFTQGIELAHLQNLCPVFKQNAGLMREMKGKLLPEEKNDIIDDILTNGLNGIFFVSNLFDGLSLCDIVPESTLLCAMSSLVAQEPGVAVTTALLRDTIILGVLVVQSSCSLGNCTHYTDPGNKGEARVTPVPSRSPTPTDHTNLHLIV